MSKLSMQEIRIAARAIHDEYYEKGYDAARKKADTLQSTMIEHGNVDSDSIYEFEKHSGMSYSR